MCTLIITRRLFLIVNLRSEDAFNVRKVSMRACGIALSKANKAILREEKMSS